MSFESELLQQIKEHEGLKLKLYQCPAGKISIGYGHNIQDNGLSKTACEFILFEDINEAKKNLYGVFTRKFFESLSNSQKIALIDMMFNLGLSRFLTFKKFIQAVKNKDFIKASAEIINSRAYQQNKSRYKKLSEQIKIK
jgi:lysozyme